MIDNWVDYISDRVLPGGCSMGTTFAEFDSRPGPVRDSLADTRKQRGLALSNARRQPLRSQPARSLPSLVHHCSPLRSTPYSRQPTSLATFTTTQTHSTSPGRSFTSDSGLTQPSRKPLHDRDDNGRPDRIHRAWVRITARRG